MSDTKRIQEQLAEIKKLYDISEADEQCMLQLSFMVRMLGYSPQLTLKLLRALTAMFEVIHDELKEEKK